MRSLKKTKFAYISLLLIEIALYLLADIYFIGHLMILTVVYGAAGALIVRLPQSRIKAQVRSGARQYGKGDEIMMDVTVQAGVAARLLRARVFWKQKTSLQGKKRWFRLNYPDSVREQTASGLIFSHHMPGR